MTLTSTSTVLSCPSLRHFDPFMKRAYNKKSNHIFITMTLTTGYPGSVSSLWQQAGRAGRGGRNSLAIMIMFDGVLDQYFVQRPHALLTRQPEAAVIDVHNEVVLRSHLLCAAAECPLGILQVLLELY
jgi:ATP-dependent helicase YprA (DUF1998 family)